MMIELSFLREEKKDKLAILISLVYKSLMRTFIAAMVYKQEHILIQYSIKCQGIS